MEKEKPDSEHSSSSTSSKWAEQDLVGLDSFSGYGQAAIDELNAQLDRQDMERRIADSAKINLPPQNKKIAAKKLQEWVKFQAEFERTA
jgi:hypothetical protein